MNKLKKYIKNMSINFTLFEVARYDDLIWLALFGIEVNDFDGHLVYIEYDMGIFKWDIFFLKGIYYRFFAND